MPDRLNPAEQTAAESDYAKKFSRQAKEVAAKNSKKLQQQEATGDTAWKTVTTKKDGKSNGKTKFRFMGRHAGKLHHASVFLFIFGMLGIGLWYTSVFAPNIILVNVKEMYTNDLADATIALDMYYKNVMAYKIGRSDCSDAKSIKCRLTTMSRAQKQAFEKQGFIVLGSKVKEDNRDDGRPGNELPEERYKVTAILPPAYMSIVSDLAIRGLSLPSNLFGGDLRNLGSKVSTETNEFIKEQISKAGNPLQFMPIATGDMLFLYAQLSDANKAQVYSVFNPKSSFYMDARFKQRIKAKYNLTKTVTTSGTTESAVNRSFDRSVRNGGGIDAYGRPDPETGVSLGSLSNPATLVQVQLAARNLANTAHTYVGLECSWYALGKAITNDAKSAKAATVARFAMQYLKAADAIKAGSSDVMATNVLSSKLAQTAGGKYGGANATDSSMYKSITYGDLPIPSLNILHYLYTLDLYGAMAPSWALLMSSASALGTIVGTSGTLAMPPVNLTGTDREYCLSGETMTQKTTLKGDNSNDTHCTEAVGALAPAGSAPLVTDAVELARRTCPPVNLEDDNLVQVLAGTWRGPVSNTIELSEKVADQQLTPVYAGAFGANVMAWANAMQLLFTSSTKGTAASDAIFAGTGEILGDMAMSRGMMPSNAAFMAEYLAQKEKVEKDYNDVARYNARNNPFDAYNKFSFLGSIVNQLSPTYDSKAPVLATIGNAFSLLGSSVKSLNQSANAFYYLQPSLPGGTVAGLPQYLLRFSCADPEYLAIGITADTACNVRYSMTRLDLAKALQIDGVLDYMTKTHSDAYQKQLDELNQRLAKADTVEPLDKVSIQRQITQVQTAMGAPYIDKKTGRATPHSEYEKFLDYCVNRQDPWGRSGVAVRRESLPDKEIERRLSYLYNDGTPASPNGPGDPYQKVAVGGYPSLTEGASSDQDWYTGKKCTEQSDMLSNFRAYTMICSVDGTLAGSVDCTYPDNSFGASYSDAFFTSNDILYTSWY